MVLSDHQYQCICNELCRNVTNMELERLKIYFRDKINSKRTLYRIKTFQQLVKILEKRDVLSPEYESMLREITNFVTPNNTEILNIFDQTRFNNLPGRQNELCVLGPVPPSPIEKVHLLIRREIGSKWKEFARALVIQEGNIDRLETQHRGNIPDMVQEVLLSHRETYNHNIELWRTKLKNALETARRKDLSRKIDEIFALFT